MVRHDNPLRLLNEAGQSVWYDHMDRAMLTSGQLTHLIAEDDLRGVTSNPALFDKAIAGGKDYDAALQEHLQGYGKQSSRALFYALAVADIRAAADLLAPVYTRTGGIDGLVSLEISPDLAHDSEASIEEALQLHSRVGRPNVMIKIPGTEAGLPAIETLTAEGINVNVTLLFSIERYEQVSAAYLRGLERRLAAGQPIAQIVSVASFFISRLDSLLDPLLAQTQPELQGKIAIANAKIAYQRFKAMLTSPRFADLAAAGARPQRLLWASTSSKNPAYRDVLYVEALIGAHTVNTLPPATYAAFRDHGVVAATLEQDVEGALAQLAALPALGIDLTAATAQLEAQGIAAFVQSFNNLLQHIDAKMQTIAEIS